MLLSSCCRARPQLRTQRCIRAEPFPPTLRANPFIILFICLLYICLSDFVQDTQATTCYGPRAVRQLCTAPDFEQRLQIHVPKKKKKKKAFIIDFLTFQSSERALGCVKPTFLIKSPVVTFDACASGEQSFRPFLKPGNVGLIKQRGWILPLSPEKLSFFHDF